MTSTTSAALWISAYLIAVTAPLFALLLGPVPPGGGFWWDFAMALGFAALAMMGVQFLLTARFRRATAPFGIDIIFYFHRYLALFALGIAALHYFIIRADNPAVLGTAHPLDAPPHMTAGRVAIVLFALVIASSLARRRLRIEYDLWRWTHALTATTAFVLALWHVVGTGYYIDTPWKTALWTAYGLVWIALIGHVRVIKPWQLQRAPAGSNSASRRWATSRAPRAGRRLGRGPFSTAPTAPSRSTAIRARRATVSSPAASASRRS